MKTYKEQLQEIKELSDSIVNKSKKFTEKHSNNDTPYYEDLLYAISELKDIDNFLK